MQRTRHFSERNKDTRAILIGGVLVLIVGASMIIRNMRDETSSTIDQETAVSEESDGDTLPTVSADVLRQKILNGEKVSFLDIRGEESFRTEHIPHSLPVAPGTLGTHTPGSGELLVVVFSAKDTRTLEVVKNTLKQKSSQVFLLEGGFEEWKRGGNQTISLGDPNSFIDQSKVTYIAPAEAVHVIAENKDVFILDVQSEQNFQKKHVKGAKNIPLDQLEKRSQEIPPAKNIIVYGESELASFQGGVRLSDLNVFTAKTLSGNSTFGAGSGLPLEP